MHTVWQLGHNRSPAELIKRDNTRKKHLCIFLLLKLFYFDVCSKITDFFFLVSYIGANEWRIKPLV